LKEIKINEGHIHGIVSDMRVHLGIGDFKSALKKIDELKKYVKGLKSKKDKKEAKRIKW